MALINVQTHYPISLMLIEIEKRYSSDQLHELAQILLNAGCLIYEDFTRSTDNILIRMCKDSLQTIEQELKSVRSKNLKALIEWLIVFTRACPHQAMDFELEF